MNRIPSVSAVAGAALSVSCAVALGQAGPNLVYNGNFELGNAGISTDYGYFPCGWPCNLTPGHYTVTSNPNAWNPGLPACTDHTHLSGSGGQMMVVDGVGNGWVWVNGFNLQPRSAYRFRYWWLNLNPQNPPRLTTRIYDHGYNLNISSDLYMPGAASCTWAVVNATPESPAGGFVFATSSDPTWDGWVGIGISDGQSRPDGNDFALDDLELVQVPCLTFTRQPATTSVCEGLPTEFSVAFTGIPAVWYQWEKDGTSLTDDPGHISGSNTNVLSIAAARVTDAGTYDCVVYNPCWPQGLASSGGALNVIAGGCRWHEIADGHGDAGDLSATAQVCNGTGVGMAGIEGSLSFVSDADMYRIYICDPSTFSATTFNAATAFDTQLFLFDESGMGVACNDDLPAGGSTLSRITNAFLPPAAGWYNLAISAYNKDPYTAGAALIFADLPFAVEHPADGPGAGAPIALWGVGPPGGPYLINLTGVCFGTCYANCDGSTTPPILNVLDLACFLNRYAQGDPWANCDGSTTPPILNVADMACFMNLFAAGCH
jgi:Immunoglobulin domain